MKKLFVVFSSAVFTSFIFLSAPEPAGGQYRMTDGSTPPSLALGSANGGGSDFGTIAPYNGRMNYTLPLVRVGGRGDLGHSVAVTINRNWIFEHYYQESSSGVANPYSIPEFAPWWGEELRYMPGKLFGRGTVRPTDPPESPCEGANPYGLAQTRLSFVAPDGSEITLISQTKGEGELAVTCTVGQPGQFVGQSRGTVFISNDGSAVKFVSDQEIFDGYQSGYFRPSGLLFFANGTKYRIDSSRVSWIKDRNGNKMSFSYDGTNYNSRLTAVTDSLGRQTVFSYDNQDGTYGLHDQITYGGLNGTPSTIRVSYTPLGDSLRTGETLKTQDQLFGALGCPLKTSTCGSAVVNPVVISSVWFPDNRRFRYFYNSYAELARVETPLGAAFEYDWGGSLAGGPNNGVASQTGYFGLYPEIFRQVLEKRVYPSGSSGGSYQTKTLIGKSIVYPISPDIVSTRTIEVRDSSNSLLSKQEHHFYGAPIPPFSLFFSGDSWKEGREYETRYFGSDGQTLIRRELREWGTVSLVNFPTDARIVRIVSIGFEGGLALASLEESEYGGGGQGDFEYFAHLNRIRSKTYHLKILDLPTAQNGAIGSITSQISTAGLAAVSETDFAYDPGYKDRGILSRPIEARVVNPTNFNDVFGKSQFTYDESFYFDNNYSAPGWEDPISILRGNVTTSRTWNKDTNTWLESHTMYDNFGNARKVWDTTGDPTRFIETQYSPSYYYAYPTRTIAPAPDPTGVNGTTENSEINRTFDFNTGLTLSVTDANGQTATTIYDNLLRPTWIYPPSGGSVSQIIYNDTPGDHWVKRRQQIDGSNWAESTTYFDNLGRTIKSRTKDLQGDVMSRLTFDSFGRVDRTSNPYRVDGSGNPTETVYWSKVSYDNQSRVTETFAPAPEGQTGISLGTVQFGISSLPGLVGSYVVSLDPSGRKSRAISGIYGVVRVDEATGIGGTVDQDLGSLANPTQPTFYTYNTKGELTKTVQGSQERHFMYDSFGRLIRVRQPEQTPNASIATAGNPENNQWTAAYAYDIFSNVTSVTDAKGTTITNHYDKAGRTVKRIYSDGTPQAEYFYDGKGLPQVPPFSKGSLTKVTTAVSEDRFTNFDNHGRLLSSQQITDGQTYNFGYQYNLSGGLIQQIYPSGRIVTNNLDSVGGLSSVTTQPSGGVQKTLASDFDYSPTGGVRRMKLGNGLWETADFSPLDQLEQIGLGTSATNNDLFHVDYEYGELNPDGNSVDTVKNTGMIAKTTTTMPGASFVQTFKYDAINRLTEAIEKTGGTQNWRQTFGYDRFGNRTSRYQIVGSDILPINNQTLPAIDQANNRFTTGQGYTYDLNGNLIQDAQGRTFTFNGDDKQTQVFDPSTGQTTHYSYDGSGARIKKHNPTTGETTIFVYDAGGALAAEYSTVAPPQNPTTSYLTTDHLGSPRVVTDSTGNVVSRRDFMPFGEELGAGVGPRTTNLKYSITGLDNVRQRFTGYEKDEETDLDFAEARMYQNKHGRFTAVDPLLASASAGDPQTFNRYTYTGNNPINYTDPSGLKWCRNPGSGSTYWTKNGEACDTGDDDIDGRVTEVTVGNFDGESTNGTAGVGSIIKMNANGTVTVLERTALSVAVAQGQGVVQESVEVTSETAGGTASGRAEIAFDGATMSSGITPRGMLPLPCPPETPLCGSGNGVIGSSIDTSQNAPLKTVMAIDEAAGLIQLTPGGNVPASVIRGFIAIGRGETSEAGFQFAGVIPGVSWLRKADKAVDALSLVTRNRQAGLAFERSVGITGPKKAISLADGRRLFPDEVTPNFLTEAKNVRRLSYTKQLRDYSVYSKANNIGFILKTPRGTKLSGPLKKAISDGDIFHITY